jgi:ribosomal protein L9
MVRSDLHHTSKIFRMKVKLLKDQVLGKEGDTVEVAEGQGNYLVRVEAAEELKGTEHKEEKSTHKTKEEKSVKNTK